MMRRRALQPALDWAEDTALLRSNRSADPVAENDERAATARSAACPSSPLRNRHQSVKPSRQDAAIHQAGRTPAFAKSRHSKFQFTLNQYRSAEAGAHTARLRGTGKDDRFATEPGIAHARRDDATGARHRVSRD